MESKKIIISPFAKKLRNGEENPKNYPWWQEVVGSLKELGFYIIQIGEENEKLIGADEVFFNKSFSELGELILSCHCWISIDSFLGHFGAYLGKRGVVIFGRSDPNIFGYDSNINLLKDRKYLRQDQFNIWEGLKYEKEVFVSPQEVVDTIIKNF